METQTYIVRSNRNKPRIWIEGNRLLSAGFTRNSYYTVRRGAGHITLSLVTGEAGERETRKVSGKLDRPIIDISGGGCDPFQTGDNVIIKYHKNQIEIIKQYLV